MNQPDQQDESPEPLPPEMAKEMLAEASEVASGGSDGAAGVDDPGAGSGPEPGTIADTGEPAGTADAFAAGVMDTEEDDRR